jgi:hypothetical protein
MYRNIELDEKMTLETKTMNALNYCDKI